MLDDFEWYTEPDLIWEAPEAKYGVALVDAIDSVSEKGKEILIVSNREGNDVEVSDDDETVASDADSTDVKDGENA